jgi:hypothetical protein
VLLSGTLLLRRRRKNDEGADDDAGAARTPPPQSQSSPPATLAQSAPAKTPAELALSPVVGLRPLELALDARHLSRAMVNATLAYRLTVTNHNAAVVGPLRIVGDITSAHASLSAQQQLSLDGSALPPLHEVQALAPGETAVLTGELRLPIASILPIHNGAARVFVPLARFRVETGNDILALRVFVVGQAGERPGGALRPFALDRGLGVERGLDQHELELPV